jgi:hypothetical protein
MFCAGKNAIRKYKSYKIFVPVQHTIDSSQSESAAKITCSKIFPYRRMQKFLFPGNKVKKGIPFSIKGFLPPPTICFTSIVFFDLKTENSARKKSFF